MPEDLAEVVLLRDLQGWSLEETAAWLEVPVGTVKSRLHRARLELAGRVTARLGTAAAAPGRRPGAGSGGGNMLSWACRRFRARFTPGSAHPHRRACRDCDAFAAALEQRGRSPPAAAGRPAARPASCCGTGHRGAGTPETGTVLPFAVPRLPVPLPAATAVRLRAIAAPQRPAPPEWVRSPRYAVAASALLTLLLGPFLTPAADRGLEAWGAVRQELSPLARHTQEKGREELKNLQTTAVAAIHDLDDLSTRLSDFVHKSLLRRP